MGDVFEGPDPSRLEEVARSANRETLDRRIREDDVGSRESFSSRGTGSLLRHQRNQGQHHARSSMELSRIDSVGRLSESSSVSGSRILSRLGSHTRVKSDTDDLMEQYQP